MKNKTSKSIFILISILIISSTTNLFAVDKDATFNVQKGDILVVNLKQGNIVVNTSDKNEVKVHATDLDEDEVSLLTMEQKAGKVEIKFKGQDSDNFKLELTLPADLMLDFNTGGGNITVNDDLKNKVKFNTGGGNISTKNVFGNTEISTAGGNINISDINGDADIATAGGDIQVGVVNGKADISTCRWKYKS